MSWFTFLLAFGSAFRITKFFVSDTIFARPRLWLTLKSYWLDSLLSCYWCIGFWVSGVIALLMLIVPPSLLIFLGTWLTLSALVGFLGQILSTLEGIHD